MGDGIARIERDTAPKGGDHLFRARGKFICVPERVVCCRIVVVELHGSLREAKQDRRIFRGRLAPLAGHALMMGERQPSVTPAPAWIEIYASSKQRSRLLVVVLSQPQEVSPRPVGTLPSVQVLCIFRHEAPTLELHDLGVQRAHDRFADLGLQSEHILHLVIVGPRPDMKARGRLDELRVDS